MAANLGLVADSAQAHANKFAPCGSGYRLTQGGLAHSRRTYQAEHGPFELFNPLLDCQKLENALFDLF